MAELHELEYTWKMWYSVPANKKDAGFGEGMHELGKIASVEEFWVIQDNLTAISELPQRVDYMVFKEGIEPKWEDARNASGGSWQILIPKEDENADKIWTNMVLAMLAEQFDEAASKQICGAFCAPRSKLYRFELWTSDCADDVTVNLIGKSLREMLSRDGLLSASVELKYMKHGAKQDSFKA